MQGFLPEEQRPLRNLEAHSTTAARKPSKRHVAHFIAQPGLLVGQLNEQVDLALAKPAKQPQAAIPTLHIRAEIHEQIIEPLSQRKNLLGARRPFLSRRCEQSYVCTREPLPNCIQSREGHQNVAEV